MTRQGGLPLIFPDVIYHNIEYGIATRINGYDFVQSRNSRSVDSIKLSINVDIDDFPTLEPALTPVTELWLTILYVTLYGLLFCMVYFQLWMIWYYRHKRLSYQTVFLFLCLIWTGLRTTLFSFYFSDCILVNTLPLPFTWLLYCFPVCLQFTTLCLLVLFFAQVSITYKFIIRTASFLPGEGCTIVHMGISRE